MATRNAPPGQLAAAVQKAVAGDIINLLPGVHPTLAIYNKQITGAPIVITGQPGAVLGKTAVGKSKNLTFRCVDFRGLGDAPDKVSALATADSASSDIGFEDCSFATEDDASKWTAEDWVTRPFHYGLFLRGPGMVVKDSDFFNLRNCLSLSSDGGAATKNRFRDFGNDGIDFGANNILIAGNVIRGGRHTLAEKLHADAMQGFPAPNGGVFSGITIEDNDIEFVGPGDYMQGISAFDGRWKNVAVRRNRVKAEAWHGISWYGVEGITIEDNTLELCPSGKVPWIQVCKDKLGKPSSGVTIRKNVTPMVRCDVPGAEIVGNVMHQIISVPAAVTATVSG